VAAVTGAGAAAATAATAAATGVAAAAGGVICLGAPAAATVADIFSSIATAFRTSREVYRCCLARRATASAAAATPLPCCVANVATTGRSGACHTAAANTPLVSAWKHFGQKFRVCFRGEPGPGPCHGDEEYTLSIGQVDRK